MVVAMLVTSRIMLVAMLVSWIVIVEISFWATGVKFHVPSTIYVDR